VVDTIVSKISGNQRRVSNFIVRGKMHSLLQLIDRLVPLAQRSVENSQVDARVRILRVALGPGFIGLNRLLSFASYNMVVKSRNFILFPFTDSIAQVIGFLGILGSEAGLAYQRVMLP